MVVVVALLLSVEIRFQAVNYNLVGCFSVHYYKYYYITHTIMGLMASCCEVFAPDPSKKPPKRKPTPLDMVFNKTGVMVPTSFGPWLVL